MKQVELITARRYLKVLTIIFFLTSCATIINGAKETITVQSDVKGTTFYVNGNKLIDKDKVSFLVPKKHLDTTEVIARKRGCREARYQLQSKFDPMTLLGIPLDLGLISIFLVDYSGTGAINKAAQTEIVLSPRCSKIKL